MTEDKLPTILEVDSRAFDRLHDIVWEVTGNSLELPDIIGVWNRLPMSTKLEALQWGIDTCVGDEIYTILKKEHNAKSSQVS